MKILVTYRKRCENQSGTTLETYDIAGIHPIDWRRARLPTFRLPEQSPEKEVRDQATGRVPSV